MSDIWSPRTANRKGRLRQESLEGLGQLAWRMWRSSRNERDPASTRQKPRTDS